MKSEFIAHCEKNVAKDKLNKFISERLSKQSPIIEDIPNDEHNKLVTFMYCGDQHIKSVNLYSPLLGGRGFPSNMARLGDSNYFYYTLIVPDNIRVSYAYLPNDLNNYDDVKNNEQSIHTFIKMWTALIPDPFNSKRITLKSGLPRVQISISILEMPLAPSQYWSQKRSSTPDGNLSKCTMDSIILKSQRDYWVYLPPSYNKNIHYPLLMVFDGQLYYESGISLPTIVDNLINEKRIPPIIIVLIDSIAFHERSKDLRCSESFLQFVTDELLPVINSKYPISDKPLDRILMGASLGGLFSLYASLVRPDLFGKVLSQSDGDDIIADLIQVSPTYPRKVYLDIGSLENDERIQNTKKLLLSAGHEVIFQVFPGSHDLLCWETAIPDALIRLIGEK